MPQIPTPALQALDDNESDRHRTRTQQIITADWPHNDNEEYCETGVWSRDFTTALSLGRALSCRTRSCHLETGHVISNEVRDLPKRTSQLRKCMVRA